MYVHPLWYASENEAFEMICKQEGIGVNLGVSHLANHSKMVESKRCQVKKKFDILYNQSQAMINGGKFSCFMKIVYGLGQLILPCYWKIIFLQSPYIWAFFLIFGKVRESCFCCKTLKKCTLWPYTIIFIRLNWPMKHHRNLGWLLRWSSSWYLWGVEPKKQRKMMQNMMWLFLISHMVSRMKLKYILFFPLNEGFKEEIDPKHNDINSDHNVVSGN